MYALNYYWEISKLYFLREKWSGNELAICDLKNMTIVAILQLTHYHCFPIATFMTHSRNPYRGAQKVNKDLTSSGYLANFWKIKMHNHPAKPYWPCQPGITFRSGNFCIFPDTLLSGKNGKFQRVRSTLWPNFWKGSYPETFWLYRYPLNSLEIWKPQNYFLIIMLFILLPNCIE